jgi:flavin reductase (DIM6/NTAB) family NADH-FMN oxidoreductase RutF
MSPAESFANPAWQPLAAVAVRHEGVVNAQICVSITGASIVPDRPRLILQLWKPNLTQDMVAAAGACAVTLLTAAHVPFLEALGLDTGRQGPKLDAVPFQQSPGGQPVVAGAAGSADCRVIGSLDMGDATAFLCAVVSEQGAPGAASITWEEAKRLASPEFLRRDAEQFRRDGDLARRTMRWPG